MSTENQEINDISKKLSDKDKNYDDIMEIIEDNKITEDEIEELKKGNNLSEKELLLLEKKENQIIFLKKVAENVRYIEINKKTKILKSYIISAKFIWLDINKELVNDFYILTSIKSSEKELDILVKKYNEKYEEEYDNIDNTGELIDFFNIHLLNKIADLNKKEYKNIQLPEKGISRDELSNFLSEKSEKESLLVLSYIKSKKEGFSDLLKNNIWDVYLDILKEKWKYKEIEKLLDSNILSDMFICPSFKKVVEIRSYILWTKSDKIKDELLKIYWGDEKLSSDLYNKIDHEIKNEDWKKYCSINFIKIVQNFEIENNIENKLSKDNIKKLIDWVLSVEKSKEDLSNAKKAKKYGIEEHKLKNSTPDELAGMWVSKEDIKTITEWNKNISKIRKSRKFIDSLTTEEFNTILDSSEEDFLKIKENIKNERLKKLWKINPEENIFDEENNFYTNRWNSFYTITNNSKEITNNNFIVINWRKIDNISKEEYKQFNIKNGKIWNIDAFKSFIDVKEQLIALWIDFAWEKRNDLIPVMKKISPFNQIDSDFGGSNLLTKEWFNNYLKFLIAITGEEYSNSNITDNYSTIRKINEDSVLWEEKNIQSGFWPFWNKLVNLWVFNKEWIFDFNNEYNLRKILNTKKKD